MLRVKSVLNRMMYITKYHILSSSRKFAINLFDRRKISFYKEFKMINSLLLKFARENCTHVIAIIHKCI